MVDIIAGAAVGMALGVKLTYLIAVRPLVNDIRRLRYDGFRPERDPEPRPKTVPLPDIRED